MKKRISIYIEEKLHKEFKIQCVHEGISISQKIENILKNELEQKHEGIKK